ncbi:MAG TPA: hypothetical protein DCR44_07285 [Acholeplasmatales bacterium]|nr:MAG: hypothetical protein A2Y16_02350 [Tenericutes bacterium GWF2_57_13]HAQ57178.1 hypothetical protein [Acholeplasmatales bacterium]
MEIYRLTHLHFDGCGMDEKNLGYYTERKAIDEAVVIFQSMPGFLQHPNGFVIQRMQLSSSIEKSTIFEATVYSHDALYEREHTFFLGVFNQRQEAIEAIEGFVQDNSRLLADETLCFENNIDAYRVDEHQWSEGFTADQ